MFKENISSVHLNKFIYIINYIYIFFSFSRYCPLFKKMLVFFSLVSFKIVFVKIRNYEWNVWRIKKKSFAYGIKFHYLGGRMHDFYHY